jgi:hypothetical protein
MTQGRIDTAGSGIPTSVSAEADERAEWRTPVLLKQKMSEAETGILPGPEILILVS